MNDKLLLFQMTYELDGGHVFLPPQIFLELRSRSRQEVVEIHDDMDTCVNHGVERPHSSG